MFCSKCGTKTIEGAAFCQKCGARIIYEDTSTPTPAVDTNAASTGTTGGMASSPQVEIPVNALSNDDRFKAFIDNHVQATTKYTSAEELLNSKVPQNFIWKCIGIPFILFGILMVRAGLSSLSDFLGLILVTLFFGYPAVLLSDFFIGSRASGGSIKISGSINTDELIQFLNQYLGYLFPHFNEWSYIRYTGFGVRGFLQAELMNSVSGVRIGTDFGPKKRCFVIM